MANFLKKCFYQARRDLLLEIGKDDGRIREFDQEVYDELHKYIVNALPADINIKYLIPKFGSGKCMERSLLLFLILNDTILVRGNLKSLELMYGSENSMHGWVEIGNFVYEPADLCIYDKDLYYQINEPTNVRCKTKKEYMEEQPEVYESLTSMKIEDYMKGGKRRFELLTFVPLVTSMGLSDKNYEFLREVNEYLEYIDYDAIDIKREMDYQMYENIFERKRG